MPLGIITRNQTFMRKLELTGQRFGKLLVIRLAEVLPKSKGSRYVWLCRCDCGGEARTATINLRSGNTKSCGCLFTARQKMGNLTHGWSKRNVYKVWKTMRARCQTPTNKQFQDYGGRGITVCERWNDFLNFLEDMGVPIPGMTIERKDNNAGYSKENCKWATQREQNQNKRNNRNETFMGRTQGRAAWERELGLRSGTISKRMKAGVSFALIASQANP